MQLTLLKSKIHRATVTNADLNYEGSISICPKLIKEAGFNLYEQVDKNYTDSETGETINLGQDIFSQVLFGARTSLTVGVIVVALAIAIGVPIGLLAGYGLS